MNRSRLEWKVGFFVLLSLLFAAALIMKFSKSTSVFTRTYPLLLLTSNVGGIRPGATVLMAGVQIGTVRVVELSSSGKQVTMEVQVESRYRVYPDARVTIEQAGFLGDQYISITPGVNAGRPLPPGAQVRCEEPFNLQEVARSASGLLRRVDETAARLNEAVARIDRTLLSEETLTNFSAAVANIRIVSDQALATIGGVDELVQTNASPLSTAISNIVHFSVQLDQVTEELQLTIATNRVDFTRSIQNIHTATEHLNAILADLHAGKGLAGSLLQDPELQRQFGGIVDNLSIVSSNLSQHGLLWRPRAKRVTPANSSLYPGKMPTR